ncbi:hypothetical protein N7499_006413 [Penicillium canescens]|nr:hypothetical protein N7499_006413 [Penicillium canescens]KAJ6176663.1 hypothetical protein N7485_003577 [Penicillium canescens]
MSSSRKDVIVRHTRKLHPDMSRERRNRESEPAESCHSSIRNSSSQVPELTGSETRDIIATSLPEIRQQNQHSSTCEAISQRVIDELPLNNFTFSIDENPLPNALTPTTGRLLDSFCQSQSNGANEGTLFLGTQLPYLIPANETAMSVAPSNNLSQSQQKVPDEQPLSLNDEDYANAKANVSLSLLCEKPMNDWFPSKYAVIRFVKSFFDNMAPHMPIVHEPSFRVATVAPPLLLQVMACGAIYLGERGIADEMHEIALQRVMQDQLLLLSDEDKFELWVLQALLLINVYRLGSTPLLMEQQEIYLFPHITMLASRALKEPKISPSDYQQWVYEETIGR